MPPWAHEGGSAALVARLKDPAQRQRIQKEIEGGIPGWYNHYTATGSWKGMLLVSLRNPEYKRFQGKRMSEVIAALGGKPFDVFFQVLIDNGGSVPTVYFHHAEQDMRYALKQPFVSIGSDGGALKTEGPLAAGHPHPRYYGTFPRVLGRYVRDEKVISLEEAIRKMTSANTAKVQVFDRGLLRPGQWADVTVFDAGHDHRQGHLREAPPVRDRRGRTSWSPARSCSTRANTRAPAPARSSTARATAATKPPPLKRGTRATNSEVGVTPAAGGAATARRSGRPAPTPRRGRG